MRDTGDPSQKLSQELLEWYDIHARAMPWRVSPADRKDGISPDPYQVWLSEVMLQQTTVAAVKDYFERFTARWPTVAALAASEDAEVMGEWAGLGYYARARNLLKCARQVVSQHNGVFPADYARLLELPGIGPYTAAAVAAIAYDLRHTVLDGNVERVMARLYDIHTPLPAAKRDLLSKAETLTPAKRPGDYAQAVMDLGATICTPKSPDCSLCPWKTSCRAHKTGTAPDLPKRTPKQPKPTRHGTVFLAQRQDGAWLLETRPDKGLLGGMLGWPGSDWVTIGRPLPETDPPCAADWQVLPGEVRHTFTHFHLQLHVLHAIVPDHERPTRGQFFAPEVFRPTDLPTVMRKAFNLAR